MNFDKKLLFPPFEVLLSLKLTFRFITNIPLLHLKGNHSRLKMRLTVSANCFR